MTHVGQKISFDFFCFTGLGTSGIQLFISLLQLTHLFLQRRGCMCNSLVKLLMGQLYGLSHDVHVGGQANDFPLAGGAHPCRHIAMSQTINGLGYCINRS